MAGNLVVLGAGDREGIRPSWEDLRDCWRATGMGQLGPQRGISLVSVNKAVLCIKNCEISDN